MAEKPYQWADGAVLEDHSRRKHKILREYFFNYLTVRCQIAQMERFRLAVVDGFAGGGKYHCGTSGSPLIFVEELKPVAEHDSPGATGPPGSVVMHLAPSSFASVRARFVWLTRTLR